MKRSLYLASRSADPVVEVAARAVYIFLQRAAAGRPSVGDDDAQAGAALDSARTAARDVLASRRTRLDRAFFADLFGRVPALAPLLLPDLLQGGRGARSEFVRAEAMALLQLALKTGHAAIAGVLREQAAATQALLLAACDPAAFAKPARQAEAARLAVRIAALLMTGQGKAGPKGGLDWGAVREAANAAASAAALSDSQKAAAAYQALLEAVPESAAGTAPTPRKRAKKALA